MSVKSSCAPKDTKTLEKFKRFESANDTCQPIMSNMDSNVSIADCAVNCGSTWVKSSKKGTLKIQNVLMAMKLKALLNLRKA
eukprot:3517094-Karenia_brevis.AAC.1